MDVKTGNGAFMASDEESRLLAESIVGVANGAVVKTSALITDMNEPLCSAAGNAVEVRDAVAFLTRENTRPRLKEVVFALSAELLVLGGLHDSNQAAEEALEKALASGKAAEVFARMVSGLGGPADFVEKVDEYLLRAAVECVVPAPGAGFVTAMETRDLGLAVVELGGGRRRADDAIDYAVGLSDFVSLGPRSERGGGALSGSCSR